MPGIATTTPRRLELLGDVMLDGVPLPVGGQLLVLLVVLALRGSRGVGRDELVSLLWPAGAPGAGTAALDPLISRLRRLVGPVHARGHVRLDGTCLHVDVHEALRELDGATAAPLLEDRARHAATASRMLARELVPHSSAAWVADERVRLADRRAEALHIQARCALDPEATAPALDAGVAAARQLVDLRPTSEVAAAMLMELHSRAGDRASAVAVFDALRRRLRDDLAMTPSAELRRHHAELVLDEQVSVGEPPTLPESLALIGEHALFGRQATSDAVRALLRKHRLVVLEGPPGIGKTHLAASIAQVARERGAQVLLARGTSVWPGPFSAMAGALRPLVRHHGAQAIRRSMGGSADDLAALLPGLASADASRPDLPHVATDTERSRVLEAVSQLIDACAPPLGTLLVVDDLHSVDPSSLGLLTQLVASEAAPRLALLVTTRPSSGNADALLEAGQGARMTIEGLDHAAVVEMVRAARPDLAASDASDDARGLLQRVGSTPLLLRAALSGGGPSPDLRSAVTGVVRWAGEDTARLLEYAALDDAGGPLDVLASAAGLPLHRAVAALDRAREGGLLATATDVTHDSVREALVADLGASARAHRHRQLAAAHERAGSAPSTIAAHWAAGMTAQARAKATAWEQRAAEHALATLAAEDAVLHAGRALALLADADPLRAVELHSLRGRAHHAASQLTDGLHAMREAQRRARALGRGDLVAQIAADAPGHRVGTALRDVETVALVEEGLAAADGSTPVATRARLAARLASLLLDGPRHRRDALAREAVRLARDSGRPDAIAEALTAAHTASLHEGRPTHRLRLADEALALAHAAGRPELALHARMMRTSDHLEAADLRRARLELDAWGETAREARVPYNRWAHAMALPSFAVLDGRLDRAEAQLNAADALATPLGDDPVIIAAGATQRLWLHIARDDLELVVGAISGWVADGHTTPGWSSALAYCSALIGDDATALGLLDQAKSDLDEPVDPNAAAHLSFFADAALLAGASDDVLAQAAQVLVPRRGTLVVQHYSGAVHGLADARAARLAAALGRPAEAMHLADRAELSAADAPPIHLVLDNACARMAALFAAGERQAAEALARTTGHRARAHGLTGMARVVDAHAASMRIRSSVGR